MNGPLIAALLIVAPLLAGCSDDEVFQASADTTASPAGPRFTVAASAGTILFSSNRHEASPVADETEMPDMELYSVKPDGTELTQVTDSPGALLEPRWSPDGAEVAFI